jgi:uncharacterized protein (DUF2249 family)
MATVTLDVRDFHERGEEPFAAIMSAVREVGVGEHFILINSFEPVPLYGVLGQAGFEHHSEQLGPDEWRIDFEKMR